MRALAGALLTMLAATAGTASAVPRQINYQGKVTDANGQPVADGAYNMRFKIYSAANGGSLLWEEPQAANPAKQVQVTDGLFNTVLGSEVLLPSDGFSGSSYLQIEVNGAALTPRVPLVSAPYALRAGSVDVPLSLTGSVLSPLIGLGPPSGVVRGINTSTSANQFSVPGVGVVGQNGLGNYGYLGGSYGVFGVHEDSGDYGWLGGSNGGAYGRDQSSGAFAYLGYNGFGVYADNGSTVGSKAGYFAGDVTIAGSLTLSGSLDLPNVNYIAPDAMGIIRGSDGAKLKGVGFSSSTFDSNINTYQISYPNYTNSNYLTVVTPIGFVNYTAVASSTSAGYLSITIYNAAGSKSKSDFSFVTYRLQ